MPLKKIKLKPIKKKLKTKALKDIKTKKHKKI
jgi:hypothetical protein